MTTPTPDYSALDAAILEALESGPKPFHLLTGRLAQLTQPLAKPDRHGESSGWRVLDRRLQALRKAGMVISDRKTGWRLL